MTSNETQHLSVTLGNGARATRLPVGRANGRTWLSFVIEGEDLSDWWSFGRFVRLTTVLGEATRLDGGGGGSDEQWLDHRAVDLTDSDLAITYLDESGSILAEEMIPQFPAR